MFEARSGAVEPLTMTHARIRAAQGDVAGARRVLEGILRARPDHELAMSLLAELQAGRAARRATEAPSAVQARGVADGPRRGLDPARRVDQVWRRRIRRLRGWLERVTNPSAATRGHTDGARRLVPPRRAV